MNVLTVLVAIGIAVSISAPISFAVPITVSPDPVSENTGITSEVTTTPGEPQCIGGSFQSSDFSLVLCTVKASVQRVLNKYIKNNQAASDTSNIDPNLKNYLSATENCRGSLYQQLSTYSDFFKHLRAFYIENRGGRPYRGPLNTSYQAIRSLMRKVVEGCDSSQPSINCTAIEHQDPVLNVSAVDFGNVDDAHVLCSSLARLLLQRLEPLSSGLDNPCVRRRRNSGPGKRQRKHGKRGGRRGRKGRRGRRGGRKARMQKRKQEQEEKDVDSVNDIDQTTKAPIIALDVSDHEAGNTKPKAGGDNSDEQKSNSKRRDRRNKRRNRKGTGRNERRQRKFRKGNEGKSRKQNKRENKDMQ